jgi:hypothetical protein
VTPPDHQCAFLASLAPTQQCKLSVVFNPSSPGVSDATLSVETTLGTATVTLQGSATLTQVSSSRSSVPFGSVGVGFGVPFSVRMTNTGTESVHLSSLSLGGTNPGQFSATSPCLLSELNPGEFCDLSLEFRPTSAGDKSATLTVKSEAPDVVIPLTGKGLENKARLTPDPVAFGSNDIDDGAVTATAALTNSGDFVVAPFAISIGGAEPDQFERLTGQIGDCTTVTTLLSPGTTCNIRIKFDPTTTGSKTATLTVQSGAPTVSTTLSGFGVQTELSRSPSSLDFGNRDVDDGAGADKSATITNTGTEPVTLTGLAISDGQFARPAEQPGDCTTTAVLAAGAHCDVPITFDPSTTGPKSASLTVKSNAPDVVVDLSGTGIQTELSASPTSIAFGSKDVDDGSTSSSVRLSNTGTETVTVTSTSLDRGVTTALGEFAYSVPSCLSSPLAPGAFCDVQVRLDPATTGAKSATLTFKSAAPDVAVSLTGTGTQTELSGSPTSVDLGKHDVDDGHSDPKTTRITNTGTEPVTVTSIVVSDGQFSPSSDCTTTLTKDQHCDVDITFDPSTTGPASATLTVRSNAADVVVNLTGTGTQTSLSTSPDSLSFDPRELDAGASAAQTVKVKNTGTETVTPGLSISGPFAVLSGQSADCSTVGALTAGAECDARIVFDPPTTGLQTGSFSLDYSGPVAATSLSGYGILTRLTGDPASLSFGPQDVDDGEAPEQTTTIKNTGTEIVTLTDLAISDGQFIRQTGDGDDCTTTTELDANDECDVRVRFDPGTTGSKTATLSVSSNAPSVSVDLSGEGTQTQLSLSDSAVDFGSRDIDEGPTGPETVTVTNTGTEPVGLSALPLDDATEFERLTGDSADCTTATTLAATQSCELRVRFDPASTGAKNTTLAVVSNAPKVVLGLSGNAIQTELTTSPSSLSFGAKDIDHGATGARIVTVKNTGTETVTLTDLAISDRQFIRQTGDSDDCTTTTTLAADGSCDVRITFDPSTVGPKSETLTVDSNAADVVASLGGSGIQTLLEGSASSLAFGAQDIDDGATSAQTVTVKNVGTETVTLTGLVVTGDFVRLNGHAGDCTTGTELDADGHCDVRIAFNPATTGPRSGTLTVKSDAADVTASLGGTGTQTELAADPTSLSLGPKDIDDGATTAKTTTIKNTGTETVTLSDLAIADSQFGLQAPDGDDCTTTTALAAGDDCTVRIAFNPSSTGSQTATLTVDSDAPDVVVNLSGTGTQTELSPAHSFMTLGLRNIDQGPTTGTPKLITNTGTEPVTLTSVTLTGAGATSYERLTDASDDCKTSTPLNANDTCKVRLRFDPSTIGSKPAIVTLNSNAAAITIDASGTGTETRPPATTHDVADGWRDLPVTVTLTATDDGGSDIATVRYLTGTDPADPADPDNNPLTYDPDDKPVLQNGEKIRFYAIDTSGNAEVPKTSPAAKVDQVKPTTTDDVPQTYRSEPVEVTLTASDTGGSGVATTKYRILSRLRLVGEHTYSSTNKPSLQDGERLTYWSVDGAGNVEEAHESAVAKVDGTVPQTSVTERPDDLTQDERPEIAFTSLASTDTFECAVGEGDFEACTSPWTPDTALADGDYRVRVRAVSRALVEDPTPEDVRFTIDTTKPEEPTVGGDYPRFSLGGEPGAMFLCALDEAAPAACTSPLTLTDLPPGDHKLHVVQVDAAGNRSPERVATFTISAPIRRQSVPSADARVRAVLARSGMAIATLGRTIVGCDVSVPATGCAARVLDTQGRELATGSTREGGRLIAVTAFRTQRGRLALRSRPNGVPAVVEVVATLAGGATLTDRVNASYVASNRILIPMPIGPGIGRRATDAVRALATIFSAAKAIRCTSHTDRRRGEPLAAAKTRSQSQGAAVCALAKQLAPNVKITVEAFGRAQPRATNATTAGRALNRRVLITFES